MSITRNQLLLLEFMLARGGESTATEIADAVEGISRSGVYDALVTLQKLGLVEARWDIDGDDQPRRLLRIKAAGERALRDEERLRSQMRAAGRRLASPSA